MSTHESLAIYLSIALASTLISITISIAADKICEAIKRKGSERP